MPGSAAAASAPSRTFIASRVSSFGKGIAPLSKKVKRSGGYGNGGPRLRESESHLVGKVDMINLMKALFAEEKRRGEDIVVRPDHGRHLWGEGPGTVRPGYGLYDRALGIMYMLGVWDTLEKNK